MTSCESDKGDTGRESSADDYKITIDLTEDEAKKITRDKSRYLNVNNSNNNNRHSSTSSNTNTSNRYTKHQSWRSSTNTFTSVDTNISSNSKKSIISNRKELKEIRKPSDRIQSKSLCATFCYNIPRSSIMITVPGFIILATGAILTATADRSTPWTEGGVLLVSLVFLILGGAWTLFGLIYWIYAWCKYKPKVIKKDKKNPATEGAASTSTALSDYRTSGTTDATFSFSSNAAPSSASTTFESLNSPFTVSPHPIFSQPQPQILVEDSDLTHFPQQVQQTQQNLQQTQQNIQQSQQIIRQTSDDVFETTQHELQQNGQSLQHEAKAFQQNSQLKEVLEENLSYELKNIQDSTTQQVAVDFNKNTQQVPQTLQHMTDYC